MWVGHWKVFSCLWKGSITFLVVVWFISWACIPELRNSGQPKVDVTTGVMRREIQESTVLLWLLGPTVYSYWLLPWLTSKYTEHLGIILMEWCRQIALEHFSMYIVKIHGDYFQTHIFQNVHTQDIVAHLIGTAFTHSQVAEVCTIYRMHCSNEPRMLTHPLSKLMTR